VSGTAGGGTEWSRYDVPTLWATLRGEDSGEAWAQVTAWRRTYELLAYHRLAVRRRRDELAAAWPPERTGAAAVFLDYLDGLLASMEATGRQAVANAEALTGVLVALAAAKKEIGELFDRWQRYQTAERERTVVVGLVPVTVGPAVPDSWRDLLNETARARMLAAEQEVFASAARLQVPEVFSPGVQASELSAPWPDGDGAAGSASRPPELYRPPPIAPPVEYLAGDPAALPALAGGPTAPVTGQPPPPPVPAAALPPVPDPIGPVATIIGLPPGYPAAIPGEGPVAGRAVEPRGAATPSARGVNGEHGPAAGRPAGGAAEADHRTVVGGIPAGAAAQPPSALNGPAPTRYRWGMPKGVPPILTAPPEPRAHDPGPAVIGIDR
jgi:hypothetical protein